MILQKSGFEVDPVYDGESALESIESGNYDAAVLDIMMPKQKLMIKSQAWNLVQMII